MHSRRFDRDAQLAGSRLEIRECFELQDVGWAEGMVSDRSHGDHLTTSSELEVKRPVQVSLGGAPCSSFDMKTAACVRRSIPSFASNRET